MDTRRVIAGYGMPETRFPTVNYNTTNRHIDCAGNHVHIKGLSTATTDYFLHMDGTINKTRPTSEWWKYSLGDVLEIYCANIKASNSTAANATIYINWAAQGITSQLLSVIFEIPANSSGVTIPDASYTLNPTTTTRVLTGLVLGHAANWNGFEFEFDYFVYKNGKRIF